jgi:short subunit fatty acids transporter
MGESVANMIQPFFALPLLAIAGIPMRRMMGFMVITFLISLLALELLAVLVAARAMIFGGQNGSTCQEIVDKF